VIGLGAFERSCGNTGGLGLALDLIGRARSRTQQLLKKRTRFVHGLAARPPHRQDQFVGRDVDLVQAMID
jgi:hypothetical protein